MSSTEDIFSIENLELNLRKARCLCSIIGYDNIIKQAQLNQENLGIIARAFGISNNPYQSYLESLFKNINDYQITYPNPTRKLKEDLLNPDKDDSTLTEIEVTAKLAPFFKITPEECPISESKSNLDLLIEDKNTGEKALIEIATSFYDFESHANPDGEAHTGFLGGKGGQGYKINNALDRKLGRQLNSFRKEVEIGNTPLKYPLIILFKNDSPLGMGDFDKHHIYAGLYENFSIKDHDEKIVYRQTGFYHKENIEFISKIGVYTLQFDEKYSTIGRFYEPIKTPQRKMSSEFERKLENILFDSIT